MLDYNDVLDLEDQFEGMLRLGYAAENFEKLVKLLQGKDILDKIRLRKLVGDIAMDLGAKVSNDDLNITRRRPKIKLVPPIWQ